MPTERLNRAQIAQILPHRDDMALLDEAALLEDGTAEGIAFTDIPAFSVQYHPEANPGPTDSHYLFKAFCRLMDGCDDYLDIDIAADRLEGWRF